MKVSIFIPAYNAAMFLESVIARIPERLWGEIESVWIINDGSSDKTGRIADELREKNPKIKPIHFAKNRGYGNAVRRGLELCAQEACDFAACVHADGQYPPESIPDFLAHMSEHTTDILQGSRIASGGALSGGMPLYKLIAGKALTFFENMTFGLHLTDYHSGFLMYSSRALQSIPFGRLSASFDFDLEVIASARARKLIVEELPIPTRYAGEESHLNPVTYGLRCVGVMIKYRMGWYR